MTRRAAVVVRGISAAVLALLPACTETLDLPTPAEIEAVAISGDDVPLMIELSWKEVLRIDHYLVHYDIDRSAPPYGGRGLGLQHWPTACGDFDGAPVETGDASGAPAHLPANDAGILPLPSDSPLTVPATWCFDMRAPNPDAAPEPVASPSRRPRLRLVGAQRGKRYTFALQAARRQVQSPLSAAVEVLTPP